MKIFDALWRCVACRAKIGEYYERINQAMDISGFKAKVKFMAGYSVDIPG